MSTTTVPEPSPRTVRRASVAGFLGTTVEAYDFFVFTFLIVYTSPLFFPSENPASGVLSSLLVLGTGLLARPVGGIFFGWLGDRKGRRFVLVLTIVGMGIATFLMGVLPTYESVGLLAPILLVLVRLVQGLSAGGELMGSATYVAEHSTRKNHGILNAMTPMGFAAGTALAPGVVALVTLLLSEETMATWGWRVPLLLSLPLTACTLYLRNRLEESPEFRKLADLNAVRRAPVRAVFTGHPVTLIKIIVISGVVLAIGYIVSAFLPLFLQQEVGLAPGTTAGIAAFAAALGIILGLGAGLLVDRIGRRWTMILILALIGAAFLPVMYLMKSTGNIAIIAVGQLLLAGSAGAVSVPAYAVFTSMFPASVRYTGAAIGFGVGSALGGGFGPYVAAQLTEITGSPYAAAGVVMACAVIGIAVISTMPNRGVSEDDAFVKTDPAHNDKTEVSGAI